MTDHGWPEPWWKTWLFHPLMLPKWALTALFLGLTLWLRPALWPWLVPLGFLAWFPLEYMLHRFVFHALAHSERFSFASKQHIDHHLTPDDPDGVFVDPYRMAGYSVVLFGLYWGLTLSWHQAIALTGGTYAGLVYYEYMHLLTHAPNARPKVPWTKAMKRWHLLHHYKHEEHWFGVTNTGLDHALGTATDPQTVEKSDTVRTLGVPEAVQRWLEQSTASSPSTASSTASPSSRSGEEPPE